MVIMADSTSKVPAATPAEKPAAPGDLHYFVWEDRKLFRTTDAGAQQERWDADAEEWVDAGSLPYDKGYVRPDPYFVEIDKVLALSAYPAAFPDESENLLRDFEKAAETLTKKDGVVSLSAQERAHFDSLLVLAQQMLDASKDA